MSKKYCNNYPMQRQLTFGLIIIAGLLAFAAINLWSTNRLVTSNNVQANNLKAVIQTNQIDAAIRREQLNVEQLQLRLAEEQLRLTERSSPGGTPKVTLQPSPSPSSPPVATAPIYISTGDNSTWPSSYGALLAGVGALAAALVAALTAWRSRKAQPTEADRSQRAPDVGVNQPPPQGPSAQSSTAGPDP